MTAAMGYLLAAAANAAEPTVEDEVISVAARAASTFVLDDRLYSMLVDDPLGLTEVTRRYEVVDLEDYADPTTATLRVTEGAILLRDPSEAGALVRYRFKGADGEWVRDDEGRFLVSTWYGTEDGRLARVIRNADGQGVGTYTIDPSVGGYELALDLDADAVVDVHDVITSDGHEQISVTALGREWVDLYLIGYNALCYSIDAGGIPGSVSLGAAADPRAVMPGCNLTRGGSAGGFAGSLGAPAAPTDPIAALCDELGGKDPDGAAADLRERIADSRYASGCEEQCSRDLTACLGSCRNVPLPSRGACVDFCLLTAMQCDGLCEEEVEAEGETTEPPPQPPAPEVTSAGTPSRFVDSDDDGVVDAEDVNGDGVPDVTCASVGCGTDAYPPPFDDGVTGADWGAFCRHEEGLPDTWGAIEDTAAGGCPDPLGNPGPVMDGKEDFAYLDACGAPPKDQDLDEVLMDGPGSCEQARGCEPKTIAELRAAIFAANEGTLGFLLRCDDPLCQPLPF